MTKQIIDKFKEMSDEELKIEFIKYFGEEKWDQEEALGKLWPVELALADYLGVEPIPVIVDDIEEERLDYTMNFDDVSTHKTDNDEASIFRNKRLELLSIFVNKSKNNEPADLTDIEDFDYFVQRYWDLEWKHDAIAYEKK